jgi:hypothetical protein
MPACSRPATSCRMRGMSAVPGTTGLADIGEAASVVVATRPADMAGHMPITTGHPCTTGHGAIIGSADITGHGVATIGRVLAITEAAGTIGPVHTIGPEVSIGLAGTGADSPAVWRGTRQPCPD